MSVFFSSRRRHTRSKRDWSSDVCSSDLVTAHFYTDMGLLTCDYELGEDLTNLFNALSGFARTRYFHKLHTSPDGIRDFINQKIEIGRASCRERVWISVVTAGLI